MSPKPDLRSLDVEAAPFGPITTRERLLDATRLLIEQSGWSSVTMAKIAAGAGVSRQTVHNEFGSKHGVAEALAMRELANFLAVVRDQISAAPDLATAIQQACQAVLELAAESVLVRTIVGSVGDHADVDFLKLMTTESGEIVAAATFAVKEQAWRTFPDLPFEEHEFDIAVESVVRLVLSHITRPSMIPEQAARDIEWLIRLAIIGRTVGD